MIHPGRSLRLLLICSALVHGSVRGGDASAAPDASRVLDAYLAVAARTHPLYRADIRPGAGAGNPGRYTARSEVLGPFTYRPKSFVELDPAQQREILASSGLSRFLAAGRRIPMSGKAPFRLTLTPEEMLRDRPFVATLAPP